LKPATKHALDEFCKHHDLPAATVESLKPWFIATEVVEDAALKKLGYDPASGIDRHFIQQAEKRKEKVIALETTAEHIGVLSGLPDDLQEKLLLRMLHRAGRLKEHLAELIAAWRSGDAAALEKLVETSKEATPGSREVWEKLIDLRSARMAERIAAKLAQKGTLFVCVGAEHLAGPKGILKLLEAKGFKVAQVERAAEPPAPAPKKK